MKVYYLQRIKSVKKPRKDWDLRWNAAARAVKNKGVVVIEDKKGRVTDIKAATKDSPIWKALAKGVGGFKDAIGKGKPPFCYGSGMGWVVKEIDLDKIRKEAVEKAEAEIRKSIPKEIVIRI